MLEQILSFHLVTVHEFQPIYNFFNFILAFVLLAILIFPIGFTVRLSLSSWDSFYPSLDFIGIDNYIRLFSDDPRFWEAFGRLAILSSVTVTLQYVLGLSRTSGMERYCL